MVSEKDMTISIIWGIEDVKTCIEDNGIKFNEDNELTDIECFEVLKLIERQHDSSEGITWEIIDWGIRYLYNERIKKII